MARLKQGNLFEEDLELQALREREKKLEEAHRELAKLPAKLELDRQEREATMPPMAEIEERREIHRFEEILSRGQIENVLRTQRQSLWMMLLLATTTVLLLVWAYRVMME